MTQIWHFVFLTLFVLSSSKIIWKKPEKLNKDLPPSVEVFRTTSDFAKGHKMTASYCDFDLADPDLEFKVVYVKDGESAKTLPEFIAEEPNHVYMIANGGFFDIVSNTSHSLLIQDGYLSSSNRMVVHEMYKGQLVPYYPTQGAFGIRKDGTPEITWVYNINDDKSQVYSYPQPAPNCYNCPPGPMPDEDFPPGGAPWEVNHAIGGSPVLLKNGVYDVTMEEEMINRTIGVHRHPRTALCVTKEKKVKVVTVDGRSSRSDGLFYDELAELLHEIGCYDALNLDGGSSTAMLINGEVANSPVNGELREVLSAVMLVSKSKPNLRFLHKK